MLETVTDLRSIPGLGRSPRGGDGKPLQYSCLENPMDRGAWQSTVHGVTKSWTFLGTHTGGRKDWANGFKGLNVIILIN